MRKHGNTLLISLTCLLFLLLQLSSARCYAVSDITTEQWQQLTSDKAFGYKNDTEAVQKKPDYKQNGFEKAVSAFFKFWSSTEGNVILWIIVVSTISYIIYRVFIQKDSFLFGKDKKAMEGGDGDGGEEKDLATTNWEALLHNAVSHNDFRLAVRYSYMWMLQLLQHRELIQYRIDKTNYEYANELSATNYKQPFKQLSRQYEYAWYGRFELSHEAYNEYRELFDTTRKQLGA